MTTYLSNLHPVHLENLFTSPVVLVEAHTVKTTTDRLSDMCWCPAQYI